MLSIPSGTNLKVTTGIYRVTVGAQLAGGQPSSSSIHTTAVLRLGAGTQLDLHFFFLDLGEHPCQSMIGTDTLDSEHAPLMSTFRDDFLGPINQLFGDAQIVVSAASYEDILDQPDRRFAVRSELNTNCRGR